MQRIKYQRILNISFRNKEILFLVKHLFTFIRCILRLNKCDHVKQGVHSLFLRRNPTLQSSSGVRHTDIETSADRLILAHMKWDKVKWDRMEWMKWKACRHQGVAGLVPLLYHHGPVRSNQYSLRSVFVFSHNIDIEKKRKLVCIKISALLNRQIKTQFNVK